MFRIDTAGISKWHGAVTRLATTLGEEMFVVFREECRQLLGRIITGYKSPAGRGVATPPDTLAQGRKAVRRDILRAVNLLRPEKWKNKTLRQAIRDAGQKMGGSTKLQQMIRAGAFGARLRNAALAPFTPAIHSEQRDQYGHVPSNARAIYVTTDTGAVEAYIEDKQAMVGQAKGGWAAAYAALGGTPPDWVGRHASAGTFTETYRGLDWELIAHNRSAWTNQRGEPERMIEQAIEARGAAIEARLRHLLEQRAKGVGDDFT